MKIKNIIIVCSMLFFCNQGFADGGIPKSWKLLIYSGASTIFPFFGPTTASLILDGLEDLENKELRDDDKEIYEMRKQLELGGIERTFADLTNEESTK